MCNELISIIIPTYNPPLEKFKKCLKNVLEQSYTKIEVLIIDDGSNDSIKEFLKTIKDFRVKIISQNNQGVSVARNRGIQLAKGKYICFVDSDDYIDHDWLAKCDQYLAENYDIIFGRVMMCTEKTLPKIRKAKKYRELCREYSGQGIIQVQEMLFLNEAFSPLPHLPYLDLGPCGKLYRRELIKNIYFPEGIKLGEDQVFNHSVLKKSSKVLITNYKAYYYLQNPTSAGHRHRKNAMCEMMNAMRIVYKNIISKKELNAFII